MVGNKGASPFPHFCIARMSSHVCVSLSCDGLPILTTTIIPIPFLERKLSSEDYRRWRPKSKCNQEYTAKSVGFRGIVGSLLMTRPTLGDSTRKLAVDHALDVLFLLP